MTDISVLLKVKATGDRHFGPNITYCTVTDIPDLLKLIIDACIFFKGSDEAQAGLAIAIHSLMMAALRANQRQL